MFRNEEDLIGNGENAEALEAKSCNEYTLKEASTDAQIAIEINEARQA